MASDDAATRARANAQTWLDESCGDEPLHDCDDLDWARDVVAAIDGLRAEVAERTRERDALRDKKCIHILAREFLEGSDGK